MSEFCKIHHYFELKSRQQPERIAVICDNQAITYKQLDSLANEFQDLLSHYNVATGDRVALNATYKSPALIACILGILKSGATYVPLSSSSPELLKESILNSIKPKLLISDKNNESKVTFKNLAIEQLHHKKQTAKTNLANNIAYIIHTSGTTDIPKGVAISHDNLIATYESWSTVYNLSSSDKHLQMAGTAFDVFTGDWIRALCSGASLVLCQKSILLQPEMLFELINKQAVTHAEFVPAVLNRLLNYIRAQKKKPTSLKMLICGSDIWTIHEYKLAKSLCSTNTRIVNSYGITEASIDSTYFEITDDSELDNYKDSDIVPIGKPFPHVTIDIFDNQQRKVSSNTTGEMYISGKGVSKTGYIDNKVLTKDSFPIIDNKQYYRTGDQAKISDNGTILFLGRNTLQTNIHGKRVDILSIEATLKQHPNIVQALVIAEKRKNRTEIHAFLITNDTVIQNALVKFLKSRLPSHYLPHSYQLIDKLPLTPQNKVDRKLASIDSSTDLPLKFEKAHSALERAIALIWQNHLNQHTDLCISTPYASLGGIEDNYLAMIAHINQRYGIQLKQHPSLITIKSIAQLITKKQATWVAPIPKLSIAVVGGGPAAISFCQQLIAKLIEDKLQNIQVTVFEKNTTIGAGLPYQIKDDCYILNLPVDMMALGANNQEQFKSWFTKHLSKKYKTKFPPRHVFGTYINHTAQELIYVAKGHNIQLEYITDTEITSVQRNNNNTYTITSDNTSFTTNNVVFCTGHMPSTNFKELSDLRGYYRNPWSKNTYKQLNPKENVAVIGSRVSAIDVVVKLKSIGHTGKITLFSRDGLLPAILSKSIPHYNLKYLTVENINLAKNKNGTLPLEKLMDLFWQELSCAEQREVNLDSIITSYKQCSAKEWLKHEIKQAEVGPKPWQQALFAFYPHIPNVWTSLSLSDKEYALKHYHSIFLTYLAAFPLDNAYKLLKWLESGELEVIGGLKSITHKSDQFCLLADNKKFLTKHLFNATGPGHNASDIKLFQQMQSAGLCVPHPCGGINVNSNSLQLHNKLDAVIPGLYAIGELTRGTFWATTDMSQVNNQCRLVVPHLVKNIKLQLIHKSASMQKKKYRVYRFIRSRTLNVYD